MDSAALMMRLHQHQENILAIMRGAEPLLRDPVLRDVPALARARWAVMRALAEYQRFKHDEIFDPTIARALWGSAERAARLKQACTTMGEEFRGYVAKWSSADVEGEWSVYQPAALAMIARLRAHIATERAECAALIDQAA